MIRTILKDIQEQSLKHIQCHEHLFIEEGASKRVDPVLFMNDPDASAKELQEYHIKGGSLIVDAQPGYFGRMAGNLAWASQKSKVDIVASTGFHKMAFCDFPERFQAKTTDEIAAEFVLELTEGMIDSKAGGLLRTGYKAGAIKTAVESCGLHGEKIYEKLFHAAAFAQKMTGAPILCHIEKGADALEVIAFLVSLDVDPEKIIICHLDRAKYDLPYHLEVAKTGVYFDYDTVNRLKYLSHEQELALIQAMIRHGHAEKIMVSLDTTRARLKYYGGDMGLAYILDTYTEMMKAAGVHESEIRKILCNNAKKALTFG